MEIKKSVHGQYGYTPALDIFDIQSFKSMDVETFTKRAD